MGLASSVARLRYKFYGGYASSELNFLQQAMAAGLTFQDLITAAQQIKSYGPFVSQDQVAQAIQQAIGNIPANGGTVNNIMQVVSKILLFASSALKTVTNTATPTSVIPAGVGSMTIPANFLTVGKILRLTIAGTYQTPTLLPGNLTAVIKLGSTQLASAQVMGTLLVLGSTTNRFKGEAIIACQAIGANGKITIDGNLDFVQSSGYQSVALNNGGAQITIDTTVDQLLDAIGTWSAAKTSQGTVTTTALLEALN